MYVFYRGGAIVLAIRFCDSSPKGRRAIYASAFISALKKLPTGAAFEKYGHLGAVGTFLRENVRIDARYLVFDDKGRLSRRVVPRRWRRRMRGVRKSHLSRLAGAKGFRPYTARNLAAYLSGAGEARAELVALGKEQRKASSVEAHLHLMNDVGDLRNACACSFYTSGRSPILVNGGFYC